MRFGAACADSNGGSWGRLGARFGGADKTLQEAASAAELLAAGRGRGSAPVTEPRRAGSAEAEAEAAGGAGGGREHASWHGEGIPGRAGPRLGAAGLWSAPLSPTWPGRPSSAGQLREGAGEAAGGSRRGSIRRRLEEADPRPRPARAYAVLEGWRRGRAGGWHSLGLGLAALSGLRLSVPSRWSPLRPSQAWTCSFPLPHTHFGRAGRSTSITTGESGPLCVGDPNTCSGCSFARVLPHLAATYRRGFLPGKFVHIQGLRHPRSGRVCLGDLKLAYRANHSSISVTNLGGQRSGTSSWEGDLLNLSSQHCCSELSLSVASEEIFTLLPSVKLDGETVGWSYFVFRVFMFVSDHIWVVTSRTQFSCCWWKMC